MRLRIAKGVHVAAAAVIAGALTASGTLADPGGGLEGSWKGGGSVAFASGSKEHARCNARISKSSAKSYAVSGTCATQSGSVSQSAELYQLTANRYRGSFHNPEFNVNGTISVIQNGNSLTATLTSTSGTGVLTFHK